AEPAGMEANAMLALERRRERRRDIVELRPVAERVLERGQRGERIGRSWKDRGEPRCVDAEQDRAVLDEGAPVAPLRAADELSSAHLDLAAPGTREAEGGRRRVATRGAHHLDRCAQRP